MLNLFLDKIADDSDAKNNNLVITITTSDGTEFNKNSDIETLMKKAISGKTEVKIEISKNDNLFTLKKSLDFYVNLNIDVAKKDLSNLKLNDITLNKEFQECNGDVLNNIEAQIAKEYEINIHDLTNDLDSQNIIISAVENDGTTISTKEHPIINPNLAYLPTNGKANIEIQVNENDQYFKQIDKKINIDLNISDKRCQLDNLKIKSIELNKDSNNAFSFLEKIELELISFSKIPYPLLILDAGNIKISVETSDKISFSSNDNPTKLQSLKINNCTSSINIEINKKDGFFKTLNDKVTLDKVAVNVT